MPLDRDLPPAVIEALRKHYRQGAQRAEDGYNDSEEEEDSITGDLGRAMRGSVSGHNTERVMATHRKAQKRVFQFRCSAILAKAVDDGRIPCPQAGAVEP